VALGPRQRRFVLEYLVDLNGKQAAIRAGYTPRSAEVTASRLLSNAKVRAELDSAIAARNAKVELRAEDVIRELQRVGMSDPLDVVNDEGGIKPLRDMPVAARRAIASIEVEDVWDGDKESGRFPCGKVTKLKFWPKVTALEQLCKHLNLYAPPEPQTVRLQVVNNEPTDADIDELYRLSKELGVAVGRGKAPPAGDAVAEADEVRSPEADSEAGALSPK